MTARILIVDDKPNMRKLLSKVLAELGEVVAVENGRVALERLASEAYDVVLTDVRMPEVDGTELLRAVSRLPQKPEVVLMTAYATVENAVEALRHGACDYLTKPFDPDDAKATIARVLQRRAERSAAEAEPSHPSSSVAHDLALDVTSLTYREAIDRLRADGVKKYLESLLQRFAGNVAAAAEHAEVERESFYRLCRRHGVNPTEFRGG